MSALLKIKFLISQPKHMLWVLEKQLSMNVIILLSTLKVSKTATLKKTEN